MSRVTKALFGGNIDIKIQNKLTARQKVAENAVIENESVQLLNLPNGKTQTIREALGTPNFDKNGMLLAELSSRTPWARLWTAVEVYEYEPAKAATYGVQYTDIELIGRDHTGYSKVKLSEAEEAQEKAGGEKKIYVIGSHNFNRFQENKNETDAILRSELETNPFMKDLAGITSVESKTEGPLGSIKRTTVNFIVHNFNDFQKIYAKYFLKPSAHVFLDFGWDSAVNSNLYDPQTIINTGGDWRPLIYGVNQQLDTAAGDMETLTGKVVNFNSEVDENGSFMCSIEFISDNAVVLDYEIKEENKIRTTIIDNLGTILINRVASNLGLSFLQEDFDTDPEQVTETENYANTFAQRLTTSGLVVGNPSKEAVKLGIFWKGLVTKNTSIADGTFWDNYISPYRNTLNKADIAVTDDNSLYVSWGFFEEELLNRHISRGTFNESDKYGGHFNSGMSWVTYDNDLYARQQIIDAYEKNSAGLKFLYPPLEYIYSDSSLTELDTYDTIHHKNKRNGKLDVKPSVGNIVPDISSPSNFGSYNIDIPINSSTGGGSSSTINKLRLRELFINVKVIQEAFQRHETIQDAIVDVLNQLNEASYGVFDLKFISSSESNDGVAVVDTNFYNSSFDEDTFGDDFFVFKPFQKGSIVKNMALNFTTPEGGVANAIAVQNTSDEVAQGGIYLTPSERENDAIRKLYEFGAANKASYGIRHLPKLLRNKSSDISDSLDANNKSTVVEGVLDKPDSKSITSQYSFLSTQARKIQEGGTLKREIDDDGYAIEFDNTDSAALYIGLKDDKFYGNDKEVPQVTKETEKLQSEPPDIIHHDAIYANNLNELFMYQVNKNFAQKNVSPYIPAIGLTISTYGIAGLLPGDKIGVNYLPEQYLDRTFFTIIGVTQSLTTEGWETKLETQLRFRNTTKVSGIPSFADRKVNKKIFLHPNWMESHQISPQINKHFKDFQPTEKSKPGILVFNALGKKKGKFRPDRTFDSSGLKTMFKGVSYRFTESYGTPPGMNKNFQIDIKESDVSYQTMEMSESNRTNTPAGKKYPYYIVVVLKGIFAIPADDEWWVKDGSTGNYQAPAGTDYQVTFIDKVFSNLPTHLSKLDQIILAFSQIINDKTSIFDIEAEFEE